MSNCSFYKARFEYPPKWLQFCLIVTLLVPRSVYTIQPCTSLQCHFIQSHIGRVYVCLAVTCHLHFWQNDRNILRATAVTRGRKGYRNKRRKLAMEKKIIPLLLPGLEPETYRSRVRNSTTELFPLPCVTKEEPKRTHTDVRLLTGLAPSPPGQSCSHCFGRMVSSVSHVRVRWDESRTAA